MHDNGDRAPQPRQPQSREDREQERIIGLPSPFSEILKLAGINIVDEQVQKELVEWIREGYEAFLWRKKRGIQWSGMMYATTGLVIGSLISTFLLNIGTVVQWLHGFAGR